MNLPTYIRRAETIGDAAECFLCSKRLERIICMGMVFAVIYFTGVLIINIIW